MEGEFGEGVGVGDVEGFAEVGGRLAGDGAVDGGGDGGELGGVPIPNGAVAEGCGAGEPGGVIVGGFFPGASEVAVEVVVIPGAAEGKKGDCH